MSRKRRASVDDDLVSNKRSYDLVPHIIDLIRMQVISNPHNDPYPWNEYQEGANWLSNEIGMFDELYRLYTHDEMHHILDGNDFNSVRDIITFLLTKSHVYLNLLLCYVTNGGTDNDMHFQLRDNRD